MTWEAVQELLDRSSFSENYRRILSGSIREANDKGIKPDLRLADLQTTINSASLPQDPLDKIDRILLYVYRKMDGADSYVELTPEFDYPLMYAKSAGEFSFLMSKARQLLYIESHPSNGNDWRLAIEGWKHVAELRTNEVIANQAFVAMWFSSDLETAWSEGFYKALEHTGFRPIRIDLKEHNEKICDAIIAEIRKSGLLVADFTGQRGGVYFEAGFALGLGRPVIWTCREDDINNCHFDTRQYNHILWREPGDLRSKLVRRIEATVPNPRQIQRLAR